MKQIFIISLPFVFLLLFNSTLPAQSNGDYFPCTIGNSWSYNYFEYSMPDSSFYAETKSIEDTVVINEKTYYILQSQNYSNSWEFFIREDSTGNIWRYFPDDSTEQLWFDFTKGDSEFYIYNPPSIVTPFTVTVYRGVTLYTFAGTFENCIEFFFDIPGWIDDEQWFTFAPGVGLIREQYATVTMLLYKADIDGRTIQDRSYYFPMNVGNQWTYDYHWQDAWYNIIDETYTMQIINNLFQFDKFPAHCLDEDSVIFKEEGGIIKRYYQGNYFKWYDFNAEVGESYTIPIRQTHMSIDTMDIVCTLKSITDTVIFNDDTLFNCYKFKFYYTHPIPDACLWWEETYAPDIGLVELDRGTIFWVWELYTLKGAILNGNALAVSHSSERDINNAMGYFLENYPNPFNPSTTISYFLPDKSKITLTIFNLSGQEVITLVDDTNPAGLYEVQWNAGHLASGVYLCRLTAGDYVQTLKLLLIR